MGILKIKQTSTKGQSKVWKLDSRDKRVTMGMSRKADLPSLDPSHSPFQLAIEFSQGKWQLIQFDAVCKEPCVEITDGLSYSFKNSVLQFSVLEKRENLNQRLHNLQSSGPIQKKMMIVSRNNQILKTDVKNLNEKFIYAINGEPQTLLFNPTEEWQIQHVEDFEFKCRLIQVEDLKGLGKMSSDQMLDKESKKLLYATLLSMFFFMFIGLFAPQQEKVASEPVVKSAQNVVVKMSPKEKIEKARKRVQAQDKAAAPARSDQQANNAPAASANKVNALLKGAIGARISQLIGKVSATDARTANVIATAQGIKAGEGESGRALAAIGNVNSSGRNWTGEAVGTSSGKVNTAGIAGGKGTGGLNTGLSQGKTGSGNIGLLEDESEVEGGLDREIIAQYIKTQLGQILYCYERQLSANPDIHGKVAVKFTISGNGQVIAQNIGDTTLKSQPVEGCILSKVAKWKFPEPKGGTKVVVTYPFLFKSVN